MNLGPAVPPFGPLPAQIALVGEAPGSEESSSLRPFVGPSGQELRRMLRTVGVNLDDCFRTNVFSRQPPGNNLSTLCTPNPSPESRRLGPLTSAPQLWVHDDHLPELDRLRAELADCRPNIIIALGNTASWALLGDTGINTLRGTVHVTDFIPSRQTKVVPTYHPSAVLRQWDTRVIAIADLEKAHAEAATPNVSYDNTELWLAPTFDDLEEFGRLHLAHAAEVATDVETRRGQIDCVSFAPRPDISICVPFWNRDGTNYWPTVEAEVAARRWVGSWLAKPDLVKVMQNGLYDTQYFLREGYVLQACTEDTMLAHHSLYSELRKGLGFLGSIYCQRPGWKNMRTFKKEEYLKRDD